MLINSNLINKIVGIQGKTGKITNPVPTNKKSSGHELLIGALMALASLSPANANTNTTKLTAPSNNIELAATPQKNSVKAEKAYEMNLLATANSNIYYDKENSIYYKWDSKKQKFCKDKSISTIYKSGYIKTKKGEYLTPDGKWFVFRRGSWDLTTNLWNKPVDYAVAIAKGYEPTDLTEVISYNAIKDKNDLKLYYDKDKNKYYTWAYNRQDLVESPITDVTGLYYTKDNKRYKLNVKDRQATTEVVTEEEYQASKQHFKATKRKGVYETKNNNDGYYYSWNNASQTFKPFGDKYDKEQMLTQKADGKIGNFRQGEIGDCWLLSVINGMNHHKNPVLREKFQREFSKSISVDKDENMTVTLRGPKKKYTFSKEEIDSVLTKLPFYHYSIGDRNVVAVEMALENYKREMRHFGKSPRLADNIYYMQRRPFQLDDDYVLDGGQSYDAIHLITGKEAHYIKNGYHNKCILHDNRVEAGTINEALIKKYIDNNLVLASYKDKPDDDEGHVVVLTDIDDKYVYVIDSNIDDDNPDKEVHPVPRNKEDFYKKMTSITYTDFSKDISAEKAKPAKFKYVITPEAKKVLPPDYKI